MTVLADSARVLSAQAPTGTELNSSRLTAIMFVTETCCLEMTSQRGHSKQTPSVNELLIPFRHTAFDNHNMSYTIRRLFWFTAFVAIYVAVFTQLGAGFTFISAYFGFGLMIFVSWILASKYGDDEQLGWDVLFTCFAIPALIFLFFQSGGR